MSAFTFSPALIRNCRRCSRELAPGALVCQNCQALVYADEIDRLASQAKRLESKGDLLQARYLWLNALPLMPADSEQAAWIREHARLLEERAAAPQAPSATSKWAKRLAPLGPLAVLLAKFKGLLFILFKLKFLFSFAAFIGLYCALWGPKFGVGFALMIALIYVQNRFLRGRDFSIVTGKGYKPRIVRLGRFRWVTFAFAIGYFLVATALPFSE